MSNVIGWTRGRAAVVWAAVLLGATGCSSDGASGVGPLPAAPVNLDAYYYAQSVNLSWELGSGWNGEAFRVYGRRVSDPTFVLVAQVTNCRSGVCSYRDVNIAPDVTYRYFVAAVGAGGGETDSAYSVDVHVPTPTPPPAPGALDAVALDGAVYLHWDDRSRDAEDFAFYRVYFDSGSTNTLMGETDSEAFLDLLVTNGMTYGYFVTAVDDRGHESQGSPLSEATPRPDYHGEFLWAFQDRPADSGFRFRESESADPVVPGTSSERHFRFEADGEGFWLVPGPDAGIHGTPTQTTALRCGPASDGSCTDLSVAPETGYVGGGVEAIPQFSYVVRVPADDGGWQYGSLRVTHTQTTPEGTIVLFDWAFQLQPGNRNLAPTAEPGL